MNDEQTKKNEQARQGAVNESAALRALKCPKCDGPIVERAGMFFTTATGMMAVCDACRSLWDNPDRSFLKAVVDSRKQGDNAP